MKKILSLLLLGIYRVYFRGIISKLKKFKCLFVFYYQ
ncbi:hypothetical protein D8867_09265 [Streptococcus salivarius]|uniref:Uncharacterized protein n=1 Tax=Streptococcus salivarius TaxID=1304 RepID=A0AAX1Y992_STRSL|nr:hypothetical protein D8867_09265 [Streptococcus salivarius]